MNSGSDVRAIAERYLAAANRHDTAAMAALWEPGGREEFPTFEQTFTAPDEFAQHFDSLFLAFPDVQWETVSVTNAADLVVVRSKMHGTHLGSYQGIAPTRKRFSVDTIDFLRIRNGKIVHNEVIFDGLRVLRQLGVLPPPGSTRERAMQSAFNVVNTATSSRTIEGQATTTIERSSAEILEFVLDLERYRQADHKFHRIQYVKRHNNHGEAKYSGRLRGIPTPTEVQEWSLEPYTRLDFRSRPSMWPGMIARFRGSFECEEMDGHTVVHHREAFEFRAPFSWLAVPFLSSWLQRDVEDEVIRLKRLLES